VFFVALQKNPVFGLGNCIAEGSNTLLNVNDLELVKGKIYTIWVVGSENADDDKEELKAHVFINR
jgi:hypothetical protein